MQWSTWTVMITINYDGSDGDDYGDGASDPPI
jgi:hypothetical protein